MKAKADAQNLSRAVVFSKNWRIHTCSPLPTHEKPFSVKQACTARITASYLSLNLYKRRSFLTFASAILFLHESLFWWRQFRGQRIFIARHRARVLSKCAGNNFSLYLWKSLCEKAGPALKIALDPMNKGRKRVETMIEVYQENNRLL